MVPETGLEFSSSKVSRLMARDRLEGVLLLEDFASVLARRFVPLEGDVNGVVGNDLRRKQAAGGGFNEW